MNDKSKTTLMCGTATAPPLLAEHHGTQGPLSDSSLGEKIQLTNQCSRI